MDKLKLLLTVVIITSFLLIGVNQAVGAQELQSDRLTEILLTRVNAILVHLFGEVPTGCEYANPLCDSGLSCVDNVCVDDDPGPISTSGHPYQLNDGWNTISPVNPDMVGVPYEDLFPNAVSLYTFDVAYVSVNTMSMGIGYFIKNGREEVIYFDGVSPTSITFPFDKADTFFVGAPFALDLSGISCISKVSQYDDNNPSSATLSNADYRIDYSLEAGQAAFVETDGACTITCTVSGGCSELDSGFSCTDTDGGKVYSTQGTTSVCPSDPAILAPCTALEDHCVDDDLIEGFCSGPSESSSEKVACPNGCQDGRCLADPGATDPADEGDTTPPVVLISYHDGTEYTPLVDDTLISLPQSYPIFSVSISDDQADKVSCRFYDDTSGSLSSDGEVYDFDNPIVLEPIPMVDSDFDSSEPKLANGTYRFKVVCYDESDNAGTSGVIRFRWESKYVPGDCTFRTNAVDGNYRSGTWIAVDVDGDSQLEGLGYSGSTGMLSACRPGKTIAVTHESYPVILDAAGDVSICQPVSEAKISMKKYHVASSSADTSTTPRSPYDVNGQEVCDGSTPNPDIDFTDDGKKGGTTVSGNIITGSG